MKGEQDSRVKKNNMTRPFSAGDNVNNDADGVEREVSAAVDGCVNPKTNFYKYCNQVYKLTLSSKHYSQNMLRRFQKSE